MCREILRFQRAFGTTELDRTPQPLFTTPELCFSETPWDVWICTMHTYQFAGGIMTQGPLPLNSGKKCKKNLKTKLNTNCILWSILTHEQKGFLTVMQQIYHLKVIHQCWISGPSSTHANECDVLAYWNPVILPFVSDADNISVNPACDALSVLRSRMQTFNLETITFCAPQEKVMQTVFCLSQHAMFSILESQKQVFISETITFSVPLIAVGLSNVQ